MGMGYGANFDYVITVDEIKKVADAELANLLSLMQTYNISLDTLARELCYGDELADELDDDDQDVKDEILGAFEALQNTFQSETGIRLFMGYHNKDDEGDRYDEVDGGFFRLDWNDVLALTPQAKALRDKGINFELSSWVTYG